MIVFQSMTHVTVFVIITVFFFLFLELRKNPFHIMAAFVHKLVTSTKYLVHFGTLIAVLFFNKIEIILENHMHLQADFTPSIYKLEGEFVSIFQRVFQHEILTYVLTYFYVVVFPALMIASVVIYTYQKNDKLFHAVCYALMFNYMIAIPFYLFFPVNEVHAFNPHVKFLVLDVFPTFEQVYRPLSALNNCVPSLHTSISVSIAMIALKSNNAFWRKFVPISAAIIVFSIFYLGIHWLTDMTAGLFLGLFASHFALRLSEGTMLLGDRVSVGLKKRNIEEKW